MFGSATSATNQAPKVLNMSTWGTLFWLFCGVGAAALVEARDHDVFDFRRPGQAFASTIWLLLLIAGGPLSLAGVILDAHLDKIRERRGRS